jgi:ubiquinone/menaquinone biosynthesis C-methylase UbiE
VYLKEVNLKEHKSSETVNALRVQFSKEYEQRYGRSSGKGLYTESDWRRISFAYDLVGKKKADSVLDVGTGPGALLNLLTLGESFSQAKGIDIRRYSKLVEIAPLDIEIMSVDDMKFPTSSFDTVVCMEVLEHIDIDAFLSALKELRRVAKKQLLMSIPLCEPEPLPSFHKLRFELSDVHRYFPTGEFYLLNPIRGIPWLLILESY